MARRVFYQVGGCWTASRGETSGIDWRYSAGREAGLSVGGCLRGGGGGGGGGCSGRLFTNLT